ncbi:MAG: hypothetical protein R3C44_02560 [Chloroflexota bacterium]
MDHIELLLTRLDDIGRSLAQTDHALALIGMGSVGQELDRLDAYSDLDFFAIVEEGYKAAYLYDLDWLSRIAPIAYAFQNTADGYKVLYADGVFCEFAIFAPDELVQIDYAPGRLVWGREDFDATLVTPRRELPARPAPDVDWLVGEAITNLYVGLGRFRRGEKLSAFRFIQEYAVDRIVELSDLIASRSRSAEDPFDRSRRYEQRYPALAERLSGLMQGYDRSPESAVAILFLLEEYFPVDPAMKAAILSLAEDESDR